MDHFVTGVMHDGRATPFQVTIGHSRQNPATLTVPVTWRGSSAEPYEEWAAAHWEQGAPAV
ncbi:hypothetical protein DDJ31_31470 [Streptomyces griseoviridis]|uniref:Uncharacterized protein n=1 Tax=Streptomyces griseoviridis TaxID=45398 RepID=A0ABX5U1X0_STRGD|nr:hypothetical protein DDJ31_31470 [Streptomyces griseoviridis]